MSPISLEDRPRGLGVWTWTWRGTALQGNRPSTVEACHPRGVSLAYRCVPWQSFVAHLYMSRCISRFLVDEVVCAIRFGVGLSRVICL